MKYQTTLRFFTEIIIYIFALLASNAVIAAFAMPTVTGETVQTVTVRTSDGKTAVLPKNPRRVVICYGSFVGAWYATGGTAVGIARVNSKATLPEAARELPSVGSFGSPNPEQVLALNPDLVLLCDKIGSHHRLREILDAGRIANLMLSYENYRDFVGLLDLFSRLNGTLDDSTTKAAKVKKEVDDILAAVPKGTKPRFLSIFFSAREFAVETSGAHTVEIAESLGGRNVIPPPANPEIRREKFSMEQVILSDPDLILAVTMGNSVKLKEKLKADMAADDNWKSLRAVKTGRVYFLPNDLFLYKPNERFPEAFALLRKIMYDKTAERIVK